MRFRFRNFNEFWPYYLRSHSRSLTRGSHYLGIGVTFALVGMGIALDSWVYAAIAVPTGYVLSLIGHLVAERNLPVTFFHPLWSLRSVFRMFSMAISGRLGTEMIRWRVKKAGRKSARIHESASKRS